MNINPDIQLMLARRQARIEARKFLDDCMAADFKKPSKYTNSGNPKPRSRAKPKTCTRCATEYPQSKGYFSKSSVHVCLKCTAKLEALRQARKAALGDWWEDYQRRKRAARGKA